MKTIRNLYFIILFLTSFNLMAQETEWTLEACIQYMLEQDFSLKEIELNSEIQQQEVIASYGRLLPNASLYADHQYNFGSVIDPSTNARISSDIQSNVLNFSSQLELFNWGNFVRIHSAKLEREKVAYNLEVAKNEAIIQVVKAFMQVQFNQEQVDLLENQLKNTKSTLERMEQEFELGNKSKSDLYELIANKTAEEQQLTLAKNNLKSAKTDLLNLLNIDNEVTFVFHDTTIEPQLMASVSELYDEGVKNRPELKAAELEKQLAKKSIQEQRSAFLPRLYADYAFSSFYVDVEKLPLRQQFKNNKTHYIGLSISIPIFNRLQTRTSVQKAKVAHTQSKLKEQQQKQAYYNALREVHTETQNALDTWEAAKKNLAAQEVSFDKTEHKFLLGMIDAYGYFAAKNNFLSAQTDVLQAKYTYQYQNVLLNFYVTNEIGLNN